ncbi:dipeptide/oligopeptide/nickel ABC transporter ATP-binding protein [Modestobacter sp. VKM Ac-2977]|uniref:ABC transporter ATP-binding protein n=1 Tax=Modestobacter sp. VKM Ac-2977 TaxID=3004131 RepID=UPI0022AA09A3|nr:dipeptide/oligopeptide/nickel ABC transporter ATP-binding protein [Modestobacter sp. VKM Ac-2977]MCZ2820591.1 dipeptide/oligopeptide/nickel ABC transporter ATP-binding protein [Modestobacter sp. VKM Ac-2977]
MSAELLLAARGLTRRYRGSAGPALDRVDLGLTAGQRLAVVGESGAGKSTLTRLLLGLERPDAGEVTYRGRPVQPGRPSALRWFRRAVQVVPQDPGRSLNPRMRVGQAVAEPLRCLQVPGDHRARVAELLRAVGLDPDAAGRLPHEFSGGQRQRIALARALAPRPEVLIADEPVSALDAAVRLQVVELLRAVSDAEGVALLVVSHDLGVVTALCSDVVVLAAGRVVESGPVARVLTDPVSREAHALVAAVPRLVLA